MSTSDVFTAIGTLVAIGVAVAGATLFILRTLRKKSRLGGGDLVVVGFFVILALVGSVGAAIVVPKIVPSPQNQGGTHTTNNDGQTNKGNNNVNMTHDNIYILVGQNLPAPTITPDSNPISTNNTIQIPTHKICKRIS